MTNTSEEKYYLYTVSPHEPITVQIPRGGYQTYFDTIDDARNTNYIYKNRTKYNIGIVRITTNYQLESYNVDPPTQEERSKDEKKIEFDKCVDARVAALVKEREDAGDPYDIEERICLHLDIAFNMKVCDMLLNRINKDEQAKNQVELLHG